MSIVGRLIYVAKMQLIMLSVILKLNFQISMETVSEKYDAIISNPPIRAGKEVVHEILTGAFDYLNDGGHLTIVIQKTRSSICSKKNGRGLWQLSASGKG